MKKILSRLRRTSFLLLIFSFQLLIVNAQGDVHSRDSCVNTSYWQVMVRSASLNSAYTLLEDSTQHDQIIIKYSQLVISQPQGNWLPAMSYGVMASDPDLSCASNIYSVQFRVNQIYAIQAYAILNVLPPGDTTMAAVKSSLNKAIRKDIRNGQ
jgi:hypothetical protein